MDTPIFSRSGLLCPNSSHYHARGARGRWQLSDVHKRSRQLNPPAKGLGGARRSPRECDSTTAARQKVSRGGRLCYGSRGSQSWTRPSRRVTGHSKHRTCAERYGYRLSSYGSPSTCDWISYQSAQALRAAERHNLYNTKESGHLA